MSPERGGSREGWLSGGKYKPRVRRREVGGWEGFLWLNDKSRKCNNLDVVENSKSRSVSTPSDQQS